MKRMNNNLKGAMSRYFELFFFWGGGGVENWKETFK